VNCPARLQLFFKGVSVPCHKYVISFLSFLDSKVVAGGNGSEQRTIGTKWRWTSQAFLLFLVNSWIPVRNQWFSAKAV
jgi:hypothetical protein